MKKFLLIIGVCLSLGLSASAQVSSTEVEIYQSVFGLEKKAIVMEYMALSDDDAKLFWPIYEEYETARKAEGKKLIDILVAYANQYEGMTAEQADELVKRAFKARSAQDKILSKYYGKVKKSNNALLAAKFYQIEAYFINVIRLSLSESLPFIGEDLIK